MAGRPNTKCGGIVMKNLPSILLLAVSVTAYAADRAAGQGSTCRNGMCPYTANTFNVFAGGQVSGMQGMSDLEKQIVQIEKNALDKWYVGDPSAYIEIMGQGIGYFEPSLEKRLDGREPLSKMYESLRGKVHAEKYDMLNTRVQPTGDMAVLSFNLISIEGGIPYRWNCTEVFALDKEGKWKIIHSHWSQTKPERK
jgi:ketosteroid isomerase-like protein